MRKNLSIRNDEIALLAFLDEKGSNGEMSEYIKGLIYSQAEFKRFFRKFLREEEKRAREERRKRLQKNKQK